jgi:hypothetical protein
MHSLVRALEHLQCKYGTTSPFAAHTRTRARMQRLQFNPATFERLQFHEPFGFFDFIALERDARFVF